MRRRSRLFGVSAAVALALGLGLAGCSSSDEPAASESDQQSEEVQQQSADAPVVNRDPDFPLPDITGAYGEDPEMTPVEEAPPSEITLKVLEEGDGAEVGLDDIVTVNYSGFLWDNGEMFDSSFVRGQAATFSLNQVIPGWKYGLAGTRVGDRILLVVPPEFGYGDVEQGNIPANSTLVFVVDIVGVVGADTSALEEATVTDNALPAGMVIEGDLGTEPTLTFEDGAEAPTAEETVVIAEGTGPVITAEDTVVYHYVGSYWGGAGNAATTWSSGPQLIAAGDSLFLGEKVGSRIAMVFPSDADGQPAMVMVVDILSAVTP